jgi:crotonobetainyl-CoA:carnitine CoA-transferase CaiB-like acyl-CoA transferase
LSRDALEHVRVVEFGGYAAGPAIGKYLANFGARVVHVESQSRPDGFRLQYPPYKDDVVGINGSGCFSFFNDSKRGVTLELKTPEGQALAYRLVEWADVVIENMRPGVMSRLGLGWEVLRHRNPSLVMLSTTNMGQTGPLAAHPGFGSQLSSLSGFTHLIGDPEGPPGFLYGPYIDFIAAAYGGCAVLAGLDHTRRTGEGVFIDLAQYEAGLQFVGTALLDHAANGVVATRNRNRDPVAVPHGCYPCAGGGWCVLSCWDDAEWQRLCALAEQGWAEDARFANAASRRFHEDELNAAIGAWTLPQPARELMTRLQAASVHAAVVNTVKDLFNDPQLAARGVWQEHLHTEIGPQRYRMVSYQLSETPGRVRRAAPCLGQDNEEVFTRWLGLEESLAV